MRILRLRSWGALAIIPLVAHLFAPAILPQHPSLKEFRGTQTEGMVSRNQIIDRARSWALAHVPYDQLQLYNGYREDCSGLVSAAWGLKQPGYTTYTLPSVAYPIQKDQLEPGDILNNRDGGGNPEDAHVLIFVSWSNGAHTQYNAYEEDPYWGGAHYTTNIPYPFWPGYNQSYQPMRYKDLAQAPAPNSSVIAHDEAIVNQMHSSCTAFEPTGKGCPFLVATTADGHGGLVYAITLLADAGDSCAGSIVYFFDGERLITDTTTLPPHTDPGADAVTSPQVGQFKVVWRVNPSVDAGCDQYGTAGSDTYLYGWNGTTMSLLSGTPPQPPQAFPPAPPAPAAACPDSAQLLSAWDAAPQSIRQSWTTVTITGFNYITCWRNWVAADAVSPSLGNGVFVFSQSLTLRLITVTELLQVFKPEVCAAADAPPGWKEPPVISC
jgi:hypothetical protein